MHAKQLRLFPARKPLLERLGAAFFERVPRKPGVYFMGGDREEMLYIGKAGNLRQRLNRYKNAQTDRASRKLIRLADQTRSITWELCRTSQIALLRENELLRLHKPRFNRLNTRPENYLFIGLRFQGARIETRLTREPHRETGEMFYGAFKRADLVRRACSALFRLFRAGEHQTTSPSEFPLGLPGASTLERLELFSRDTRPGGCPLEARLKDFFSGEGDSLLDCLVAARPAGEVSSLFGERLLENDLETLREFFRYGPRRNRDLRRRVGLDHHLIDQAELDDLLSLTLGPGQKSAPDSSAPETPAHSAEIHSVLQPPGPS